MKKLLLFLTLLIVGMSANAQFSPSNNLNYIKLLKNPPIGTKADSLMVFNGTDKFVKMIPTSSIKTDISGKEDISNKTSKINGYSETLYPNEKATHDALDAKLNLSDLPSNLTLYATNVPSGVSTYTKWVASLNDPDYNTTAVDIPTGAISGTAQLISGLSSIGGVITGNPGIINVTTVGNIRRTSGTGTAKFYFELYKRTLAGVETLLGVSDFTLPVDFNTYSEFSATAVWNDGIFTETDRIVIKFYGSRIAGGGDPTFDFQFGGLTPVRTIVPVPFRVVAGEYELKANKQNSLAVDGTGIKYPTVDATNAGLALKQNTLTNPITGTGTTNTIPKFTGTNTLGDGIIRDNVNVSIGTGGFSNKLTLYSAANEYALRVGQNTSNVTNSFTGITFYNSTNTGGTGTATGTASLKITRTAANLLGNMAFLLGATQVGMFDDYGHLLIATPSSNGIDGIQTPLTISHAAGTTANQGVIKSQLDLKADIASPTFTGVPNVPTATAGTNTTQIASTAFVVNTTKWVQSVNDIYNVNTGNVGINQNTNLTAKLNITGSTTGDGTRGINLKDSSNTDVFYADNSGSVMAIGNIIGQRVYSDFSFHASTEAQGLIGNNSKSILNGGTKWLFFGEAIYGADYSSTYVDRSLTDKGYVDKNRLKDYTVATLPISPTRGDSYVVTDALAPNYLSTLTGGGTVKAPVFYDGTVWRSTINAIDTSDIVYKSGIQTITGLKIFTENVYATGYVKTGGTASQFLKADGSVDESDVVKNIAKDATQGANITGTVSETILYSKLIPANTFKDGDFMNLFSRVGKTAGTATLTQRIKINTSNTLTGATLIAANLLTNAILVGTLTRTFTLDGGFILGTISSQLYPNDLSNVSSAIESNTFNTTVDNYIFITGQLSDSSITMFNLGTKITN